MQLLLTGNTVQRCLVVSECDRCSHNAPFSYSCVNPGLRLVLFCVCLIFYGGMDIITHRRIYTDAINMYLFGV